MRGEFTERSKRVEVTGSNLGPEIGYPDRVFRGFLSSSK
jgi:hypothetical protein